MTNEEKRMEERQLRNFKDICPEDWIRLNRPYIAVFKLMPEDQRYSDKARVIGKVFSDGAYTGRYTLARNIKEMISDIEQACFQFVCEAPGPGDSHDLICVYV